jgi:hypothetical protein
MMKIIIVATFVSALYQMMTPLVIAQDDDKDNQINNNQTQSKEMCRGFGIVCPPINSDMADPIHYYCPMPPPNRTCNAYRLYMI